MGFNFNQFRNDFGASLAQGMILGDRFVKSRLESDAQKAALQERLIQRMKDDRLDGMANTFLNKMDPPRAEAVNPSAELTQQMQAAGFPTQGTAPHAEGVNGLKLAAELQSDDFNRGMALMREQRMQDNFDYEKEQNRKMQQLRLQQDAQKAIDRASDEQRRIYNDTRAYYAGRRLALNSLQNAKTDEEYDMHADEVQSAYEAAISNKLQVSAPMLPPRPSEVAAQNQLQEQIDDLQADIDKKKADLLPDDWQGVPGMEKEIASLKKQHGATRSITESVNAVGSSSSGAPMIASQADYDALPAGSQYTDQSGQVRTKHAASSSNVPVISTQAEFDALPSGSEFIGPSGRRQRKQ